MAAPLIWTALTPARPPPPPLPFLPYPSGRSAKRRRCQMTRSRRQTQTADSGGKGFEPEDSNSKTAGICAGGEEQERDGGSAGKRGAWVG